MNEHQIGQLLREGKTKLILEYIPNPSLVVVRNKPVVTWDDKFVEAMPGKDIWATTTTSRIFEHLVTVGIPVAYEDQLSETEYLAPKCEMVPVEVIIRFGNEDRSSYSKRHPDAPLGPFEAVETEFFLKTSGRTFNGIDFDFDDPYIHRYDTDGMWVHDPKKPVNEVNLIHVPFDERFGDDLLDTFERMGKLARDTGTTVRGLFQSIGWNVGDFKVEFGYANGELLLADSLDNDSWRVKDEQGIERSKQTIRNGGSIVEAMVNYELVADATKRFRLH